MTNVYREVPTDADRLHPLRRRQAADHQSDDCHDEVNVAENAATENPPFQADGCVKE